MGGWCCGGGVGGGGGGGGGGSRWAGLESVSQTDAQTVDLTLSG